MKTKARERPILFSGEMVRAILEGRKTMTRRVVKPQPSNVPKVVNPYNGDFNHFTGWAGMKMCNGETGNIKGTCHWKPPYGVPGDRLWVRETWRQAFPKTYYSNGIVYRADKKKALGMDEYSDRHKWKPSIYMPRWASRILLEITSVKVERLQDITEEDAVKEGIEKDLSMGGNGAFGWKDYLISGGGYFNPITSFKSLWNSINGPGAWDRNDWVWVIEFKRVTQ